MHLLERLKKEKEEMHPLRWKLSYIGLPVYLLLSLTPFLVAIPFMENEQTAIILGVSCLGWFFLCSAVTYALTLWTDSRIVNFEKERYGYLFRTPNPLEKESIEVLDEDLRYTLHKEGARLELLGVEREQVFDELRDNVFFVSWERAEFALATQTYLGKIYFALAIISLDFDVPPFFVPFNEEVYAFIKEKGFDKRLEEDWEYLFYNPDDAFKQILKKGRIVKYRDKKGEKPFREPNER